MRSRRCLRILATASLLGACSGSGDQASAIDRSQGDAGGATGGDGAAGDGTTTGPGTGTDGGTNTGKACTKPVFVTSDPSGGWSDGGYYVHNNMWNTDAHPGPETLSACSYSSWYVVSNQTNSAGAVKTYPNVHKDYDNVPISSFNSITSWFAETSPHVGIYNVAYDIWTNGIASPGSTEFMIWTENFNQVPAGDKLTSATLGNRTYDVWKTSDNGYIAFVPTAIFTSGTIDILEIFKWTMAKGWLPPKSTLGQIDFGVEIVSTNGADATFQFTDFLDYLELTPSKHLLRSARWSDGSSQRHFGAANDSFAANELGMGKHAQSVRPPAK